MAIQAQTRWHLIHAVQWAGYDLDAATAACNRTGWLITAAELVEALKVSCGRRQDHPLVLGNDSLQLGPGTIGVPLRMAAAKVLCELARRGYAG